MSVVVTGAAGFLGRALVASLAADGIAVVAVDRRPAPGRPRRRRRCGPTCSTATRPSTRRCGPPTRSSTWPAGPGVRDDRRRPSDAARATGQRARDGRGAGRRAGRHAAGRHLVLVGVRRQPPAGRRREADPLRPLGGVRRSKAAVELLCARPRRRVAVLRPFTVAGEGQRPDMALARWIARASGPAGRSGSSARRSAPGTSPTCATWSGRCPAGRRARASSGRSTSAPGGRARWPSWPARCAGCWARRPSWSSARPPRSSRPRPGPTPPGCAVARLRAGHRPGRRGRPAGRRAPARRRRLAGRPAAPASCPAGPIDGRCRRAVTAERGPDASRARTGRGARLRLAMLVVGLLAVLAAGARDRRAGHLRRATRRSTSRSTC